MPLYRADGRKNLGTGETARHFRWRQAAEQFHIGEVGHTAIGVFDISSDFDRPRKARRGRVQGGKVFNAARLASGP